MDLLGVTRTIDHAVYMLLNAIAIILWRIASALIGISMLGYNTQDWLTGAGGGVWTVADRLTGPNGILGLDIWQVFLILAVMLFGISRVARPFLRTQPVDLGRLFLFAVMSYVVISQGSQLMQDVEAWRSEAGSYMYSNLSNGGAVDLDIPGNPPANEPLYPPAELDGQNPIRGWEAVATSYFLVQDAGELHAGVPPADFRLAYCLYDPNQPIDTQDAENAEGCSPQKAWDEWDLVSTQPITEVWGIPLPDISLDLPVIQEHPENRQLAIRQAQAGVARLALGPVVALFPLIEANISLMLALSASFLYLSLPIALIFGFFLKTETMVNQLLLQLITVMIRTLILNGLVALFLMLLISVTINGSLMSYLGLVGVGLAGGFILTRFATATMKDSFSQAMGAVGGVFLGATAATLGQSATAPAQTALGLAKLGATAGVMGAAGMSVIDLAETGLHATRSGVRDLNQAAPTTMKIVQRSAGRLPAPLARMAQQGLSPTEKESDPYAVQPAVPVLGKPQSLPESSFNRQHRLGRSAGLTSDSTKSDPARPFETGSSSRSENSEHGIFPEPLVSPLDPTSVQQYRQVEQWLAQVYHSQAQGRDQQPVLESGRDFLGEDLAQQATQTLQRRSQPETEAIITAAREVAAETPRERLIQANGQLTPEAIGRVQEKLAPPQAQAFSDRQGRQDLATLSAVVWQEQRQVEPQAFRQALAQANDGQGERAPGRTVPRTLGLDPVASQAHFAGINRFVRLSDQAGLSETQRRQLLLEAQQEDISPGLREQLKAALQRRQRTGQVETIKVDDLVASAEALPHTLTGPSRIRTGRAIPTTKPATETRKLRNKLKASDRSGQPSDEREIKDQPAKANPNTASESLAMRVVSGRVAGASMRPIERQDQGRPRPSSGRKDLLNPKKKVHDETKQKNGNDSDDSPADTPDQAAQSSRRAAEDDPATDQ